MGEPTSEGRKSALKGRLVEGVRLIFIALLATGGFELGAAVSEPSGPRTLLYVFLGAGIGYVIGGVLGRLTLRAVTGLEHELRRTPAPQLAGAVVGMVVGLIIGALLMVPLLFLPAAAAWPTLVFLYMVLGSLGFRVGAAKYEDIFGLVGMKPRAAVASRGRPARDRHQRVDRRPRRRPGGHRVRRRHDAVARRRPPRAAVDLATRRTRAAAPAAAGVSTSWWSSRSPRRSSSSSWRRPG